MLLAAKSQHSGKRLGRLKKGRKVPEPEIGDLLLVIRVRSVAGVAANIRKAAHALRLVADSRDAFVYYRVGEELGLQWDFSDPETTCDASCRLDHVASVLCHPPLFVVLYIEVISNNPNIQPKCINLL